ncbi:MAG: amino acid ABC transporter substrate-binding protein [Alphaproteobacteria bacterium]
MEKISRYRIAKRAFIASCFAAIATAALLGQSAAATAADVIRIGTPLALTGGLADEGRKQKIAYDMWLQRVNAAGGIKVGDDRMLVEFVEYDYQTDGKRAQQLVEKMITRDKVDFLMAPFGSGHTKIVAAVAERYEMPLIASVSSSLSVYDQGFKNLFGTLAPNTGLTDAMFRHFSQAMPNATRVAILGRDDVFPRSMAKALAADAGKFGYDVVYNELYAVGTLDHSSAVTRIKTLDVDWVYVTGYTQDLVLFRKQMVDLGLHAPIVTMITGPAYREFVDSLGTLAEGVTSASWWHHATAYESSDVFGTTAAFTAEFRRREGHDPDYVHASSAAALIVLQQAIEIAGSKDRAKVRDALTKIDTMTFYGPIKFGANGMNQARDLPIIQIQDGQPVVLAPANITQAKMISVPRH